MRWQAAVTLAALLAACAAAGRTAPPATGIHKIRHVIVIMQENRSFDQYFGTFPGADGLPASVCLPDPAAATCVKPYHDPADKNAGGPHGASNATADIDGGKMDGFIAQAEKGKTSCQNQFDPTCTNGDRTDVMGYKTQADIPNYWAYAQAYTLQDHMFEPNASWSLPEHLFMVSEWSATCSSPDPMSCRNALQSPQQLGRKGDGQPDYAWTDLTYLLHKDQVSWKYYVVEGIQPDCADGDMTCAPQPQKAGTPEIWNPLPWFETVHQDGQLGNIQTVDPWLSAVRSEPPTRCKSQIKPIDAWRHAAGGRRWPRQASLSPHSYTALGDATAMPGCRS